MAGLADISGGRADYGYSSPSRSLFDDLAAKAMQTQEVPVAPQNGYIMPSAPIIQDSPFAQYAWRTVPNLFGGLGVQPLMGYSSAYPHVLNGTPDSFLRWIPMLQSMMPPMQPLQWPQQKQGKTVQPMSPVSAAAQTSTTTTPARNVNVAPPVTIPTQPTPQRVRINLSEVQPQAPQPIPLTPVIPEPEYVPPQTDNIGWDYSYQEPVRTWWEDLADWAREKFAQTSQYGRR